MATVVDVNSLFDQLDINKNGMISRAELEAAIQSGAIPPPPGAAMAYAAPQQMYLQQEPIYAQAPQVYAQQPYEIPAGYQLVYAAPAEQQQFMYTQEPQQVFYAAPAGYEAQQPPIIHTAEPIYITEPAAAQAVATYAQAPVYEFQQAQAPVYEFQQAQAPVYESAPQYGSASLPSIITTAEPVYLTGPAPAEFSAPQTYAAPQAYQPLPSMLVSAPSMYAYQAPTMVTTTVTPITAATVKKATKKRACGCC